MDTRKQKGRETKAKLDRRNNKRTMGPHQKNDDRYKYMAFDNDNEEIITHMQAFAENF